jgi:hypothetical protein
LDDVRQSVAESLDRHDDDLDQGGEVIR